jgi:2-methylcitrate dehydratase PrpD
VTSAQTISGKLADFIHRTAFADLPPDVVEKVKVRVLDCLGSALAAKGLPVPSLALAFVKDGTGPATVIGEDERLRAIDAAFVNAALINGRSQDDFLEKSHPGALTVSAGLAVAEAEGCSGEEFLAAIVLGYEVVSRIYRGGPRMLPRFRASGVAGTVGAAATAAKLLKFGAPGTMNALGCGAIFAHGFGQGFLSGTNDVKLNVAMASRNGVSAAMLAKHGATASPLAFEGESGFYRAFDGSLENIEEVVRDLGKRFFIEDTVYKECPVCIFTQTPLALARRLAPKVQPDKIEKVVIRSPELTHTNPGFTNVAPFSTHLQAVVSARFCAAAALLGRPVEDHDSYDELGDREILALAEKIELQPRLADMETVDVEVTQNGHTITESSIENETLRPTAEKVIAKFRRLTDSVPGVDQERIIEAVMQLDSARDVGGLTRLLRPSRSRR